MNRRQFVAATLGTLAASLVVRQAHASVQDPAMIAKFRESYENCTVDGVPPMLQKARDACRRVGGAAAPGKTGTVHVMMWPDPGEYRMVRPVGDTPRKISPTEHWKRLRYRQPVPAGWELAPAEFGYRRLTYPNGRLDARFWSKQRIGDA